ncbi:MAG: hypothetical protein ACLR2K_03265 [Paraclostridium sordellii]
MIKRFMSILLSGTIFFTGALNNNIFADYNSDYDTQFNETNRIFDNTINSEKPQLYSVVNPGGSNGWKYKYSHKENVYLTTYYGRCDWSSCRSHSKIFSYSNGGTIYNSWDYYWFAITACIY